jgi:hypothetical protein
MLREAQRRGIQAALEKYRIKEAGVLDSAKSFGRLMLVGELPTVIRQARKGGLREVFRRPMDGRPGGALHHSNVLWPTIPGSPTKSWAMRGLTALPALGVIQAARGRAGDPNESRLSNTLGALGSTAGLMYGGMAGGMIGAPILGSLGHHIGKGVGRIVSKKPQPPAPAPPHQIPPSTEPAPDEYPLSMSPYSRGV